MASYKNFSQENRRQKDSVTTKYSDKNAEARTTIAEQELFSFSKNKDKWRELCSYWRQYPDRFIDKIRDPKSKIKLYFYQRIYLRIIFRYRKVFLTATRGTSKSYLINLAFILLCIMFPGIKLFTCARIKEQAAKISQDCINDIFDHYPLLRNEVKQFIENKDYTKLVFHNGSKYDVVQMQDSTRGGRRHGGCVEEIGSEKFDGDMLHSVVIPLMANNRLSKNGKVDNNEIHKREIYITTACKQQQFAYQKLQEVYKEMIKEDSSFALGNSYELPCMYGQLDIDFVESLRESPTFSLYDFMREYESLYTGSSSDALVSDEKLQKSRCVGVAEFENCGEKGIEYCLAYDVSRNEGDENALSCLVVIKMTPKDNGDYLKEVVNIFSREGEHSTIQAKFLKEKVREFKPRILVIDNNGLGVAVTDQLVLDLGDGNPPYSVVNDDEYDKYAQPDSIPILYALKAQNKETKNTDMINHFMQVFSKIDIGLLKSSHEGIKDVEKKIRRKLKDSEEIAQYEIPYLLTTNLCEEISNLKYKQAGSDTQIERVSRSIPKDKFSALMYGLYWIYSQEKKNKENVKRRKLNWFDYIKIEGKGGGEFGR
ncbi:MAG: DNA-packaging protein [Dehalococcoidia bacterium]|nr:MAG: DNA-packaging protein [Dehalococcoidia bacterium]